LKLVQQKKRGCLEAGVFPEGTRKKKVIPMVIRRAYRRVSVNEIDRQQLLELTKEPGNPDTVPGLDIARHEIVACLRWDQDHFERPWKIIDLKEIGVLVELCELLKSHCTGFSIGLESIGT